jgi:hypothetical protein
VAEHITICPQLLATVVLHLPEHAVALSGVQHALPTQTSLADAQSSVPPVPHGTACPQLFITVPQVLPRHVVAAGSGTQPHAPLVHVSPPSQPPHMMVCPQLSVDGPQRFWHHTDGGVGLQHVLLDVQTPPPGHAAGQSTVWPQEFIAVVLHLPRHAVALSGVQHVSSDLQTSAVDEQDVVPPEPQATACPQLFIVMPQFLPVHVVVNGSGVQAQEPSVQDAPPEHCPQSTGLLQLSCCAPHRFVQ